MAAGVREHLGAGEEFRAAVWVSRADEPQPVTLTRADVSPFRFRRRASGGARYDVSGSPGSVAVDLGGHIRNVTEPRLLAVTDCRLLVLSRKRSLFGAATLLRPRWECPRARLAAAAEQNGRLRLTFTDHSIITLLTPAVELRPFLAAVG